MKNKKNKQPSGFEKMSIACTKASGSSAAFIGAVSVIILWVVTGPVFKYSDTWQLVINTGTTIVTFLMVFLIQRSQNKDSVALHLKLNELIAAHEQANNHLVSIEDMSEDELKIIRKYYKHLADLANEEKSIEQSHSIAAAQQQHKRGTSKKKRQPVSSQSSASHSST